MGQLQPRDDKAFVKLHLKGDRYEEIALPSYVLAVLACWYARFGEAVGRELTPDDAVFPAVCARARALHVTGRLEPMSQDAISYIVKKRLALIDIKNRGWAARVMRATAATVAHEQGATVEDSVDCSARVAVARI